MTARAQSQPTQENSDRGKPSEVLLSFLQDHLRRAGKVNAGDPKTVGCAVEILFEPEADEFHELMGADHIYPSALISIGAEFVDDAIDLIRTQPPHMARKAISNLIRRERADVRARIAQARPSRP